MRTRRCLSAILVSLLLSAPAPTPAALRGDQAGAATPPRLSFAEGDVSFWRPGAEDWAPAQVNMPLAEGDAVYAPDGANVELQLGSRAYVRAGSETQLGLENLDDDFTQFKVTGGHVALDLRRIPGNRTIEVDTPHAAVTIERPGYYRLDVDDERTVLATSRQGTATVIPAGGESTDVGRDERVVIEGTDYGRVTRDRGSGADEWDRWNLARTDSLGEPRSSAYVPADVAGTEDLDRYGEWREEPAYGHVWRPYAVVAGWAPYSTGRWVWDPYYGWTWIDDAPWGWAPYHYGRWVYTGGYWGWAPGPVVVAPVYAPALVAFFHAPGVTVSVGTPFVSWVALGWGEPCVPWWGRPGFVGHAWWGGWGGPRVVNNVVIQHNTYVNVRNIHVYRNQRVDRAVVGIDRGRFGHGRDHLQLASADTRKLRPVHGALSERPTRASLVPREGHGRRPSEALRGRSVVATRAPKDPGRRLAPVGLDDKGAGGPPARVVQTPALRRGGDERHGAPGDRQQVGATGRQPGTPHDPGRDRRPNAGGDQDVRPRDDGHGTVVPRASRERETPPRPRARTEHGVTRPDDAERRRGTPAVPHAERGRPNDAARESERAVVPRDRGQDVPQTARPRVETPEVQHERPQQPRTPEVPRSAAPRSARPSEPRTAPAPAQRQPMAPGAGHGAQGRREMRPSQGQDVPTAPGHVRPAPDQGARRQWAPGPGPGSRQSHARTVQPPSTRREQREHGERS